MLVFWAMVLKVVIHGLGSLVSIRTILERPLSFDSRKHTPISLPRCWYSWLSDNPAAAFTCLIESCRPGFLLWAYIFNASPMRTPSLMPKLDTITERLDTKFLRLNGTG